MKHICLIVAILFLFGACTPGPLTSAGPSPTTQPPTLTPSGTSTTIPSDTPTNTITSTVDPTPTHTLTPSFTPTIYFPPPTERPTRRPHRRPTVTPSPTESITPSPTGEPWPTCDHDTTSLVLSAASDNVKVGDPVQVTVTLSNIGCTMVGLPQYRLYIASDGTQPVLTPEMPDPVVHSLAVYPGQADTLVFSLTAAASGQATLTATVSYEVHIGYPGPAYWGGNGAAPLIITVTP